jgi:hypothetical protein
MLQREAEDVTVEGECPIEVAHDEVGALESDGGLVHGRAPGIIDDSTHGSADTGCLGGQPMAQIDHD